MNTGYSKIILTGATGWLGRRLVASLRAENTEIEIRCLTEPGQETGSLQALACRLFEGDLRDARSLEPLFQNSEHALVIHCAGVIHPPLLTKLFYDINVKGSENLLRAASKAKIQRLVAMSSNSPLGTNPHPEHRFDENSPYHPYMGYGKSKWQMELLFKQAMNSSTQITLIRAPWFYGPGQPARQTVFFKMIKEGKFPIVGNGQNKRSMAYIENLVSGILLASDSANPSNDIFWIADETPYTMREIITTVQNLLENDFGFSVKKRLPHFPSMIGDIAQGCDWILQSCGLYNQKIHVLSEMNKTIACDISKAKKILHYAPKVSLKEGMRQSIEWCLKNPISF